MVLRVSAPVRSRPVVSLITTTLQGPAAGAAAGWAARERRHPAAGRREETRGRQDRPWVIEMLLSEILGAARRFPSPCCGGGPLLAHSATPHGSRAGEKRTGQPSCPRRPCRPRPASGAGEVGHQQGHAAHGTDPCCSAGSQHLGEPIEQGAAGPSVTGRATVLSCPSVLLGKSPFGKYYGASAHRVHFGTVLRCGSSFRLRSARDLREPLSRWRACAGGLPRPR